jgi:hypothetical protein
LPDEERARWLQYIRELIIQHAVLTEEERDTLLRRATEAAFAEGIVTFDTGVDPWREWALLFWKLQNRNRKPATPTIRRNLDLIRKREANPQLWSLERLRRHFKFGTIRAVTRILEDRSRWLALGADLPATAASACDGTRGD